MEEFPHPETLAAHTTPTTESSSTGAITTITSGNPDPYQGRAQETHGVLGMIAPNQKPPPDNSLTPEQALKLDKIALELRSKLNVTAAEFLKAYNDLAFHHRNYIMLDAGSGLMSDWMCGEECAKDSRSDVANMMMASVELLQHNFMQSQQKMFDRFGRYVH